MEITLTRTYHQKGTNGSIWLHNQFLCHSIELPWRNNCPMISCIPEGRYILRPRWSPRFAWHMQVVGVPLRSLILLHPANNAAKELKGCIAPVTTLTGQGTGTGSRKAFRLLLHCLAQHNGPIYFDIRS